MEVKKVGAYSTPALQKIQDQQRHLRGDEKMGSQDASLSGDKVQLSKGYQSMSRLSKVVMERSDVRTKRVDHLRNLIENGSYEIDPEKITNKLVADTLY